MVLRIKDATKQSFFYIGVAVAVEDGLVVPDLLTV
jgi:hypothetical protein